jgi:membrane-anchored glycerophosphoryl diester phosphodiesterase (GDPDase)
MVLLGLLAQAVVIGGAEHVWHGQPADLVGGINKALSKIPPLIGLFLLAAVIGFFCLLLSFILIGPLVGIALAFMFMYTLPAIVVGNDGVFAALGTSWNLVRANMGPSALAFIGIFVAYIIGGVIEMIFSHLALLSVVINLIVGGLTAAFAALVVVRFYDLLRGAPASS